jgi:hypothetical protein
VCGCVGVWVCIQNRKVQNSLRSVGNCFAISSSAALEKLFELFDKKVRNYSLFDKFLNSYLNPSRPPPPPDLKYWDHPSPKIGPMHMFALLIKMSNSRVLCKKSNDHETFIFLIR